MTSSAFEAPLPADCWDGDDGQPIVYHGHTLTTKILFADVIRGIHVHAFESSPFPVILSLENHCSDAQQSVMADLMTQTFGDRLYIEDLTNDGSVLPSPHALQYKFLLKGKQGQADDTTTGEYSDMDDDVDDDDSADVVLHKISTKTKKQPPPTGKTKKLAADRKLAFAAYNRTHLSRVYPSGLRVDSSNYNPVMGWGTGSQLVALNYQTADVWEIIDPYVVLDLVGDGVSSQRKSPTIQNNGLNPTWGFTATFDVQYTPKET
ncbi:hypothetical protein DYB25_003713 [Aphanomyces astaci]|uniref:Phosphoinositide phospholipase C n=2 Tax=Aphanomyces astaci TaxID=112090 RepID=A0A397AXQ2_APHAT|nr:hypothetical protein DYB25_003713 [Aphanomyces astaci]